MDKKLLIGGIIIFAVIILGGAFIYSQQNGQNQNTAITTDESNMSHLSPEEFKKALESGEYTLIDVRTEGEYESGYIAAAVQADYYQSEEFLDYLESLDKNEKYLVYCQSGNRSRQTLNIMEEKGFANAHDLNGGFRAWAVSGFPVATQ